jgi:riboflavin kinase/FMN adenylyltransferase
LNETKRVIALGFFDGVHIGHGALIRRVTDVAAQLGAIPTALTFDPHPDSVILGAAVPLINTPADRADLMRRIYGIQEVIIARFDQRMMKMPWEEFVEDYLVRQRGVIHVVAGHDFHFGYKGMGNPERLREKCRELGIGCDIIEKVEKDGITVSSTYIRTLIAQGEIELANSFLGHPHSLTNTVGHGNKLVPPSVPHGKSPHAARPAGPGVRVYASRCCWITERAIWRLRTSGSGLPWTTSGT